MTEKVSLFAKGLVACLRKGVGRHFVYAAEDNGIWLPNPEDSIRKVGKMAKKLKIVN